MQIVFLATEFLCLCQIYHRLRPRVSIREKHTYGEFKCGFLSRRDVLKKALAGDVDEFQGMHKNRGADESLEETVDVTSRLVEVEDRELRKVEEAITRIQDGTYGMCVACEVVIPRARLNALPYAERCIACQREFELEEG